MGEFDLQLFRYVNGTAGSRAGLDAVGIFAAHWLIWLMLAVFLVLAVVPVWHGRRGSCRVCSIFGKGKQVKKNHDTLVAHAAAIALSASLLAWIDNQLFGLLIHSRSRPFISLDGVNLLIDPPVTVKSFPSDHSTVAFALAFSLLLSRPRIGAFMVAAAAMVAWGRVFVGVHFPADVLAGMVLGLAWALVVRLLEPRLDLTRRLCRLYERTCRFLTGVRKG